MLNAKFGEVVKRWRTKKGWTQEALARQLNCATRTVSRWEQGQTTPAYSALLRLESLGMKASNGG